MTDNYLPRAATLEQACEWLKSRTGEHWTLPRLLEYGLMPWFWFDWSPDAPQEIFGGRAEGYFARISFAGDLARLELDGNAIVTMTTNFDGKFFTMAPGMPVALSELRFKREDLMMLAKESPAESEAPRKALPDNKAAPALADFRNMQRLLWNEIRIDFVAGESGSVLLNVSARGAARRIALAELELINRKTAEINHQGAVLLALAQKHRLPANLEMPKRVSRLRDSLKKHFGIDGDPFEAYNRQAGYKPLFEISDKRAAADERARKDAERRTISLDDYHQANGDDDDERTRWFKENAPEMLEDDDLSR